MEEWMDEQMHPRWADKRQGMDRETSVELAAECLLVTSSPQAHCIPPNEELGTGTWGHLPVLSFSS